MVQDNFGEVASQEALERATEALQANGMTVQVVENLAEAKELVLHMIPKGSEVFTATSATLQEAGLDEALNNNDQYVSLRNAFMALQGNAEKRHEMRRIGSVSDYALSSVHAVTEDGEVLVASATGSQYPNMVFGADHVIWVVGTQKIVPTMEKAMQRLEQHVFPRDDVRSLKAYGVNSSINQIHIFKKDPTHRLTIVFVKQSAGF